MQISNLHHQINFNNKKANNTQVNHIYLQKDTVSFTGGRSTKKCIEDFKSRELNGQANIKLDEALKVLKYFGFEFGNGNHQNVTDTFGNKHSYDKTFSEIDKGFARAIIRGVQMADEFNGALFLFKNEPTPEQIAQCKRLIQENPPYLSPNNKYAQELHKQKINMQEEENISPITETDEEKEKLKEANETLARLNLLSITLDDILDVDKQDLDDKLAEIADISRKQQVDLTDSNFAELKKELLQILASINEAKETISKYEKKINSGFALTDEEKQQLNYMETIYLDFNKIKELINKTHDNFCETYLEKLDLISQIEELFNEVNAETAIGLHNYIDFYEFIKNAKEMIVGDSEELEELHKIYQQTFTETSNVSHLLDVIGYTNLEQCSLMELQEFKKELESVFVSTNPKKPCYSDKIAQLANKFNQIREKEFSYVRPISQEEKQQKTQKRIADFNKKAEMANKAKTQKTTGVIETPATNKTTSIKNINPHSTNEAFEAFINKFAEKISPLPLPYVLNATRAMLLANISMDEFAQLKNDRKEIADFIVSKNKEMRNQKQAQRLKNASRYAYIGILGNEKMSLKDISTAIKNIDNKNALFNVDILFEKFNMPMQDLLTKESSAFKKTFEAILCFMPEIDKETRRNVFDEFSNHGQYLTLFALEETPNEIKIELLKTLFESYDEKYSTSYTQQVVQNFENYIKQAKEEEMQQAKLEDLEQYDWTF